MALQHKFDPAHWAAIKAKREQVRTNPGNENSIPKLRDRIDTLEKATGTKPA